MKNLLTRIESLQFVLLAPSRKDAETAFPQVTVNLDMHSRLRNAAARLRKFDGAEPAMISAADAIPADWRDARCWQILSLTQDGDQVVGAIRMRVYDLRSEPLSPADLFAFSDVQIDDDDVRKLVEAGLSEWIARHRTGCGFLHQQGGFVIAEEFRRSPLAPVIGLSVNAWFERLGLLGGVNFATLVNNVSSLYYRFGAFPLTYRGQELPTFFCTKHKASARLLGIEPKQYEARFEPTVEGLRKLFEGLTVYAPTTDDRE